MPALSLRPAARSSNSLRARNAALWLAAMASPSLAQEYRHVDHPLFLSACFDGVLGRVVGLGVSGYSYEWDGVAWRRAPDLGLPAYVQACWADPATGRVLGVGSDASNPAASTLAVWSRVGTSWNAVPVGPAPSLRGGFAATYDAARGELVLFGGFDWVTPFRDDTWTFDGSAWTLRSPANRPPAREGAAIAYDAARQRIVLHGGSSVAGWLGDTWEWDGTDWTQIATAIAPPGGTGTMCFDTVRRRCVLLRWSLVTTEHWEYDGLNWTAMPALPPSLAGRSVSVTAFDAARGETLVLESYDAAGYSGEVWTFDGTSWALRPGFAAQPFPRSNAAIAAGPNGATILLFGGASAIFGSPLAYPELWQFDGVTWTLASGNGPARTDAVMWSQANATFVFGGRDANGLVLGDTWQWNGTSWTVVAAIVPPPRANAAVAFDTANNRAVLFGGQGSGSGALGDTWTFDGVAWQQQFPAVQPPARAGHAMVYDPVRGRVVLFGGWAGATAWTDTWEWDGAVWTAVPTPSTPPGAGTMAFDAVAGVPVLATTAGPGLGLDLWAYTGADWAHLMVDGTDAGLAPRIAFFPTAVVAPSGRFAVVDGYGVNELIALPARASAYGTPCGPDPVLLGATSLPQPGNAAFALELTEAAAGQPVFVAGGNGPASVPIGGCTLLVTIDALAAVVASPAGTAQVPLPLPAVASLIGAGVAFQAATLSTGTALGLALSRGLAVRVGD